MLAKMLAEQVKQSQHDNLQIWTCSKNVGGLANMLEQFDRRYICRK